MRRKQILLVEDNLMLSKVLARYLTGLGMQATTTTTVAGARDLLSRYSFDVLVVDMNLPDKCGLDLVRLLTDSSLPVVAMTAEDPVLYRDQLCKAGAAAFLEKPFPLGQLKRTLKCLPQWRRGSLPTVNLGASPFFNL